MHSTKIQDLQLLRGIAISLVLLCHLSLSRTVLDYLNKDLTLSLYWGVELFFVLSGYVVTKSLRSKELGSFNFLVKRTFRLYPAILFMIGCVFLVNTLVIDEKYFGMSFDSIQTQSIAILGGYLINYSEPTSYQYAAMWSLSVEFQFYAFVTILLTFLSPLSKEKRILYCWQVQYLFLQPQ